MSVSSRNFLKAPQTERWGLWGVAPLHTALDAKLGARDAGPGSCQSNQVSVAGWTAMGRLVASAPLGEEASSSKAMAT